MWKIILATSSNDVAVLYLHRQSVRGERAKKNSQNVHKIFGNEFWVFQFCIMGKRIACVSVHCVDLIFHSWCKFPTTTRSLYVFFTCVQFLFFFLYATSNRLQFSFVYLVVHVYICTHACSILRILSVVAAKLFLPLSPCTALSIKCAVDLHIQISAMWISVQCGMCISLTKTNQNMPDGMWSGKTNEKIAIISRIKCACTLYIMMRT